MAASTFWRVVSLMYRGPLTTFDTVRYETPANAATSLIVGAPLRLAGLRSSGLFTSKSYLAMLQRCDIFLFPRCNIRADLLECSCGTLSQPVRPRLCTHTPVGGTSVPMRHTTVQKRFRAKTTTNIQSMKRRCQHEQVRSHAVRPTDSRRRSNRPEPVGFHCLWR